MTGRVFLAFALAAALMGVSPVSAGGFGDPWRSDQAVPAIGGWRAQGGGWGSGYGGRGHHGYGGWNGGYYGGGNQYNGYVADCYRWNGWQWIWVC